MNLEEESEEVLKYYLKLAVGYSIPIFWGKTDVGISANGTAFILNTGEKKFAVTAAHVYRSYLNQKKNGEVNFCQLSKLNISMRFSVISSLSTLSNYRIG